MRSRAMTRHVSGQDPDVTWGDRRRSSHAVEPQGHLAALSDLGHRKVAGGHPDIRGWEVKTAASLGDRVVGRVDDLVVDCDALKVRYVLVLLYKGVVTTNRDHRILVPIGVGRLDEVQDEVRLDSFTGAQLVGAPRFRPEKLTRNHEIVLRKHFGSPANRCGAPGPRPATDFYDHEHFDDAGFWRPRRSGGRSRHAPVTRLE